MRVTEREAASGRTGNAATAGPEIERYLAVLRDALDRNAGSTTFAHPSAHAFRIPEARMEPWFTIFQRPTEDELPRRE